MAIVNRAKQAIIEPDFALMIQELRNNGYSFVEISIITGLGVEHLRGVGCDAFAPPKAWTGAVKLLDLYMMVCKDL